MTLHLIVQLARADLLADDVVWDGRGAVDPATEITSGPSPDGYQIVVPGRVRVTVHPPLEEPPITKFTPDGREVLVVAGPTLVRVDLVGGTAQHLTVPTGVVAVGWSGADLVVGRVWSFSSSLLLLAADSEGPSKILEIDRFPVTAAGTCAAHCLGGQRLRWQSDGFTPEWHVVDTQVVPPSTAPDALWPDGEVDWARGPA